MQHVVCLCLLHHGYLVGTLMGGCIGWCLTQLLADPKLHGMYLMAACQVAAC